MTRILLALSMLIISFNAQSMDFTCPTADNPQWTSTIDEKERQDFMYSAMFPDSVWAMYGLTNKPMVFQKEKGQFKIGYNFNAKECPREIHLEEEISTGVWKGKTVVNICNPAIAAYFDGEKDFASVWVKLAALSKQLEGAYLDIFTNQFKPCQNELNSTLTDALAQAVATLSKFEDINKDGVVDANDYEDTNGDSIVNEGDAGFHEGKLFQQAQLDHQLAQSTFSEKEAQCAELKTAYKTYQKQSQSLNNLKIDTASEETHVSYLYDEDGFILPKFSVTLDKLWYERARTGRDSDNIAKDPVTGLYLFIDKDGKFPKYEQQKACDMKVDHAVAYGGLASQYNWVFNYDEPLPAQNWSFNDSGESELDGDIIQVDLDSINFLDLEAFYKD